VSSRRQAIYIENTFTCHSLTQVLSSYVSSVSKILNNLRPQQAPVTCVTEFERTEKDSKMRAILNLDLNLIWIFSLSRVRRTGSSLEVGIMLNDE
jgi:hypothetical protein